MALKTVIKVGLAQTTVQKGSSQPSGFLLLGHLGVEPGKENEVKLYWRDGDQQTTWKDPCWPTHDEWPFAQDPVHDLTYACRDGEVFEFGYRKKLLALSSTRYSAVHYSPYGAGTGVSHLYCGRAGSANIDHYGAPVQVKDRGTSRAGMKPLIHDLPSDWSDGVLDLFVDQVKQDRYAYALSRGTFDGGKYRRVAVQPLQKVTPDMTAVQKDVSVSARHISVDPEHSFAWVSGGEYLARWDLKGGTQKLLPVKTYGQIVSRPVFTVWKNDLYICHMENGSAGLGLRYRKVKDPDGTTGLLKVPDLQKNRVPAHIESCWHILTRSDNHQVWALGSMGHKDWTTNYLVVYVFDLTKSKPAWCFDGVGQYYWGACWDDQKWYGQKFSRWCGGIVHQVDVKEAEPESVPRDDEYTSEGPEHREMTGNRGHGEAP